MARVSTKATSGSKTEFQINAPQAGEVQLVGSFTNWEQAPIRMKRTPLGNWKTSLELAPGRYEYKFIVDGHWQNDPRCCSCVPDNFGGYNCVIEVP